MSVLTFRGVRYEQASSPSGSEAPVQKLVYRSPAQEKRVIRSARTAALLQLEGEEQKSLAPMDPEELKRMQARMKLQAKVRKALLLALEWLDFDDKGTRGLARVEVALSRVRSVM